MSAALLQARRLRDQAVTAARQAADVIAEFERQLQFGYPETSYYLEMARRTLSENLSEARRWNWQAVRARQDVQ